MLSLMAKSVLSIPTYVPIGISHRSILDKISAGALNFLLN